MSTNLCTSWPNSAYQSSRAEEQFLSSYQPGGTATIICDCWATRITNRGEDYMGLGRWSYFTLRGKMDHYITIVTAYNPGHSLGGKTSCQQQTRLLSWFFRSQGSTQQPNPHRQFILDLQSWLSHLISAGHEIILSIDANEAYQPDSPGSAHFLPYAPNQSAIDPKHNGKLSTLLATCQLLDPLAIQHPEWPFPPSHIRGRNRIDYIFITSGILPSLLCSGCLPFYSLFHSDHRPYYVDLSAKLLFKDHINKIHRSTGRLLRLQDPRVIACYIAELHKFFDQHKILEKCSELIHQSSLEGRWDSTQQEIYYNLDNKITEGMLHSERTLGKKFTGKFYWSPALKTAVQAYRFWRLLLKKAQGRPVSEMVLTRLCMEGALPPDHISNLSQMATIAGLRNTYKQLNYLQSQHEQLRASFLEDLAEAIVLHQSPNLSFDSLSEIKKERILKQLKQLQFREKMRRLYKKISYTLQPPTQLGLSHKEMPDTSAINQRFGDPAHPKTWQGPWRTITGPTGIAQVVKLMNIQQYNQAFHTPFGSGPLANAIGRSADTETSQQLLAGDLASIPLASLMPETVNILNTLASSQPTISLETPITITESDFIAMYKSLHEDTSSSPSGRHVGHYKAILNDSHLVTLHATMMSLPFAHGFIPPRWTKVTDIMLQKEQNNSRCHRRRIIALFESDLNQAKRILIGRKLSHHLEDNNLLSSMQFGSHPGQQCQSALLQKVLSHGISRLSKTPSAYIENDAVGCYNRMINSLILLLLLKLGFSNPVCKCLSSLWDNTTHFIKNTLWNFIGQL
jgi:hypothetical protein